MFVNSSVISIRCRKGLLCGLSLRAVSTYIFQNRGANLKCLMRYCYLIVIAHGVLAYPSFAKDNTIADPESAPLYVIGSWVNVRSLPATNAPVVDHVTINTPIKIKNDTAGNGFCSIIYAAGKQGYIDCRLVGSRPLSLEDVGIPFDAQGNPRPSYSASKAFWLQPSVEHLGAAGKYFEATILKPGEIKAEQKAAMVNGRLTKIRRFPIPEYEAMKNRLNNGVKGFIGANKNDNYQPMPKWETLRTIAATIPKSKGFVEDEAISNLFRIWGHRDVPIELILALKLPTIKKSYFRDSSDFLPPFVTTETVSSKFDIPYRAVVKSGPKWIPPGHYNDGYIFGTWDVGAVQTNLVSPVKKHAIYRDGRVRTELTTVPGGLFPDIDADGDVCDIGFSWGDGGATIYRTVFGTSFSETKAGNRLFYFFSKDNFPNTKANLIKSKSKFSSAGFISAETFRIDVDRDGIDDIVIWEGTGISKQDIHDPGSAQANYRIVLFNITGEWHLFLVDEFLYGCGC